LALEQEIKLAFGSVEAARQAVIAAGGRLDVSRRLIEDRLFDTPEERLRSAGCAFRIRRDGPNTLVTFKGPAEPSAVKSREEIETSIGGAEAIEALFARLGLQQWFRGQKYREEYRLAGAVVTVDETPIGIYVEIEADEPTIHRVAALLGRSRQDYRLESYPRLFFEWCAARGFSSSEMTFDHA